MKTLILAILLTASTAFAAPFLVCDPSAQAVGLSYEIRKGETVIYSGPNEPDGSIKVDLKDIAAGSHTITARYVKIDPLWGTMYGIASSPFTFSRPSSVAESTKGFKLVP